MILDIELLHGHPYPETVYTVKHVYNDHTYNEMRLILKYLEIPGKHSIYFLQRSCI